MALRAGLGSGGTSCSSTRYASSALSAVSSRQQRSVTTSSRIAATSTNSGSVPSSRSANRVTTARSDLPSCVASDRILVSMVGRSTQTTPCIERGEAGPYGLGPIQMCRRRQSRQQSAPAATDNRAPTRCARQSAARQRLPDVEIVDEKVS